jgi:hypothetical protein
MWDVSQTAVFEEWWGELRIQTHGDPLRVFYAFDPKRNAILLLAKLLKLLYLVLEDRNGYKY